MRRLPFTMSLVDRAFLRLFLFEDRVLAPLKVSASLRLRYSALKPMRRVFQ